MRDNVLWRKESSIIMMLAEVLHIDAERALNLFYGTETLTGIAINWPGINQKLIFPFNSNYQQWTSNYQQLLNNKTGNIIIISNSLACERYNL